MGQRVVALQTDNLDRALSESSWDLTSPKLYVIILYAALKTADKKVTYSKRIPNTAKGVGDNV